MIIKSYNGLYEEMFSPYNIKLAIVNAGKNKTKNNKRHRELRFLKEHCDSEEVINQVRMNMVHFVPPKHRSIEINDGISAKKRNIIVPTVQEVIVHHAVLNVLKPILAKGFYEHSYASIPNRGTHRAVKVIKKWIKNDHAGTKYCLKLDVKKFFESIDQEVLIRKLYKIIRDRQFMNILIKIIRTTDKGIPLGFTTSQWFANYILTELDHKIKENFGVKYYIRFMDDMVIFGSNKKRLHQIKNQIEEYLNKELHLELKDNWQVFFMDSIRSKKKKGKFLDFLGFKFYRTHTGIRRKVALRAQRKAKRIFKKRQDNKKVNIHEARQMVVYAGLCKYANCHNWFHTHVLKCVSIRKLRKQISVYDKLNAKRRC